jgi:hypothetical protein
MDKEKTGLETQIQGTIESLDNKRVAPRDGDCSACARVARDTMTSSPTSPTRAAVRRTCRRRVSTGKESPWDLRKEGKKNAQRCHWNTCLRTHIEGGRTTIDGDNRQPHHTLP